MKQNEKIQTRKDEVRFKTSDIRRIIGKYLAANVLRTWNEDFVDDDTGEVVTIERNEILFERGKAQTKKAKKATTGKISVTIRSITRLKPT